MITECSRGQIESASRRLHPKEMVMRTGVWVCGWPVHPPLEIGQTRRRHFGLTSAVFTQIIINMAIHVAGTIQTEKMEPSRIDIE
ncbi:hypothetical protein S40285_10515 [Stachybotrys chlorohalonatus IBT 40285]|uniref:Uncharacterized protein n=1 Tax=Stachybotrys chlorohalonatus (strain IBT 40285) TaxID=1283841 RepID=A0A084QCZ6_STAC4|nr:hypothetical protein S40285_10515 [Stachybotrys chlorohalonata IBT 40285]